MSKRQVKILSAAIATVCYLFIYLFIYPFLTVVRHCLIAKTLLYLRLFADSESGSYEDTYISRRAIQISTQACQLLNMILKLTACLAMSLAFFVYLWLLVLFHLNSGSIYKHISHCARVMSLKMTPQPFWKSEVCKVGISECVWVAMAPISHRASSFKYQSTERSETYANSNKQETQTYLYSHVLLISTVAVLPVTANALHTQMH